MSLSASPAQSPSSQSSLPLRSSTPTIDQDRIDPPLSQAPLLPIGSKKYICVEYPGYVNHLDRALDSFGGERALSDALSSNLISTIDLFYRKQDIFRHPLKGDILPTAKLVAKVTRRIKRIRDPVTGEVLSEEEVEPYQTEVMGVVTKVVRFRALSDFQYIVPIDDPIRKLKEAFLSGDVDKMLDFKISMDDDNADNLRNIPPPVFTIMEGPFNYGYRQNAPVVRVKVRQPDGTFKIKLINRQKYTGFGITNASFDDLTVPQESRHMLRDPKSSLEIEAMEAVKRLFDERPIWAKVCLKAHLDPKYHKLITRSLVHYAYVFYSGPWRDTWVKYGLDPRKTSEMAIYQHISFRRAVALEFVGRKLTVRRQITKYTASVHSGDVKETEDQAEPVSKDTNTFDGKTLRTNNSTVQLCDITDPDLLPLLHNPKYRKLEASRIEGFYYRCVYDRIRTALRLKSSALSEKGKAEPMPELEKGLEEEIEKEVNVKPEDTDSEINSELQSLYDTERTESPGEQSDGFLNNLSNTYVNETMNYLQQGKWNIQKREEGMLVKSICPINFDYIF
ncbi:MAG: RNA polymerase III transcription factor IIIC subunit-domain-containing protein [Benjaminiella poitrasii]|nr:MAG: RNA polymerase III transcription factor IIIC subunit-domain-containing protein [Benjaminiella poitrasii]